MSNTRESEDDLVTRAQQALSSCNWEIGECAALWTERYAAGRTDADFGALIGLSADQVYQRRRTWERFGDSHTDYPQLKWSHFYVAVNWDDAADCLAWANEMEATVAELRAWRRMQLGEGHSEAAGEEPPFSAMADSLSVGVGQVREPGAAVARESGVAVLDEDGEPRERAAVAASAARDANGEYAPFGKGARGPAPGEASSRKEALSAEQVVTKAAGALERVVAALTPEVLEEFPSLSIALQQRFLDAVENLQSRAAGLA